MNIVRFCVRRFYIRKVSMRGHRFGALLLCLFSVSLVIPSGLALADDDDWRDLHREVQAGRIKPLAEILEILDRDWRGDVIEVDIEEDDGKIIYEIELLGPEGQVVEFEV